MTNPNLVNTWEELPHWARCLHLMRGLRGNWSEGRGSSMLRLLYTEIAAANDENLADKNWLAAVKANADTFDGHFNDGRIFRDGRRFFSSALAEQFGFTRTEGDPEGFVSASGSMAALLGAQRVAKDGWYGNYNEHPFTDTAEPVLIGECPAEDCLEEETP